MQPFFEKWQAAKGVFAPSKTRRDKMPALRPDSAGRIAVDQAIGCINCGVCYAACDTVRWNEDYLGPAQLNRAWTLVNDDARCGQHRALAGGRAEGRLPCLPFAPVVPGILPDRS